MYHDTVYYLESWGTVQDFLDEYDPDGDYLFEYFNSKDVTEISVRYNYDHIVQVFLERHPRFQDRIYQVTPNYSDDDQSIVICYHDIDAFESFLFKYHKDKLNAEYISDYMARQV